MAHSEVVRECREDGKGWRIDEKGDWWPCNLAQLGITTPTNGESAGSDGDAMHPEGE